MRWRDFVLLPERAVWRAASRTLFVADVHIGKSAAFRAAGVPVPAGATAENLARLAALTAAHDAERLVVLGDLFHARAAYRRETVQAFLAWRRDLRITLIMGNHDDSAGPPPAELGLETAREPHWLDGVECRHYPLAAPEDEGAPTLAGHLHPAAALRGPGHDRMRLPCFVMRGRQLILPAFGEFTGGKIVAADSVTSLGVIAGSRVLLAPMKS